MPRVFNKHNHNEIIPSDAVYIGRGSIAGNPFRIGLDGSREEVLEKYKQMLEASPRLKARIVALCRGKDLVCYCAPMPCHGDYLLAISNEES